MKQTAILQQIRSIIKLLAAEFFLILAHPVYKIVNNRGIKYVRIMKQTAILQQIR